MRKFPDNRSTLTREGAIPELRHQHLTTTTKKIENPVLKGASPVEMAASADQALFCATESMVAKAIQVKIDAKFANKVEFRCDAH